MKIIYVICIRIRALIACARPEKSPAGDNTNTLLDKDEYTREEMELIVDLLGNGQSTENMTDEELKELVDEIVATHVGCEYGEYDQTDEHFNKEH